jgi:hypothetical protein
MQSYYYTFSVFIEEMENNLLNRFFGGAGSGFQTGTGPSHGNTKTDSIKQGRLQKAESRER